MQLSVGIDGYNIALPRATGVGTYGVALAEALRAMGAGVEGVFGLSVPARADLRETAFFDAFKRQPGLPRKTNRYQRLWYFARAFSPRTARHVPLSGNVEKLAFAGSMPEFDRLASVGRLFEDAFTSFKTTGRFVQLKLPNPPEFMHWTYPVPIAVSGSRNIYTLHDLVPLKLPYTTLDNKELYGRVVGHCVASAAQICTVSEASKRDIVDRFAIDPDRVTNTYQATAGSRRPTKSRAAEDANAIEGIFGLRHRGYFLYFGAIEPKKNVGRLIEAYLSLQTTTPMVIVGARAWQSEQELRLIPGDGANGAAGLFHGPRGQSIMRLDYLPRDLLSKLVRGAKAVVFPSLYEGFGLPVLEAMELGTPVITSRSSSLPEVAGEAALLIDPYDVGSLQEAMRRIDTEETLGTAMAERGLKQAQLFTPERYQERLAQLYQSARIPR